MILGVFITIFYLALGKFFYDRETNRELEEKNREVIQNGNETKK